MEPITSAKLETALKQTRFVILDFSSPGCAPCKKVKPLLEEISAEAGKDQDLKIYEVDITQEPELAQQFMVLGVPSIFVFKEGKEISRFTGIPKKKDILALIS